MKRELQCIMVAFMALAASLSVGCIATETVPNTPEPSQVMQQIPPATPNTTELQRCPGSCDDGNPCTADACGDTTNFSCEHIALDGPQGNCSGSAGGCSQYVCAGGVCEMQRIPHCCGNGACEEGEDCSCPDCACMDGELCCGGKCLRPRCASDAECDDGDACTRDHCAKAGTCEAACTNELRACIGFDGCCPQGCDFITDSDCPAQSRGQAAITSNGIYVRVDGLFIKRCANLSNGKEDAWLAVKLTLRYPHDGSALFTPAYVTIMDSPNAMTYAEPAGTDCFVRDAEFLLREGNIYDEEKTGLIYYYYGDKRITQQSKKVVVDTGSGARLVWLVAPV